MNMWDDLGIGPTADAGAIRRAYAERLKQAHPEDDPEGFQRTLATLNRIGCSPHTVAALYGTEIALLVGFGVSLAAAGVAVAQVVVPDLVSLL